MAPSVSIIYVNYNTSNLLINSIESVENSCPEISLEIIIVDNASNNFELNILTQWVEKKQSDTITLVTSEQNLGFSTANNLGTTYAKGKYFFFLNPDTLVVNDAVSIFYHFMESSDKKTAACGGNLLKQDFTPNYSYGNFPGLLYEICSIGFGLRFLFNAYYKKNIFIGKIVEGDAIIKAPYITGADIFIKSECFQAMNGFDENFFMYYEETDLFLRLQKQGYDSYIIPQAKIVHFEGGAVGKTSPMAFNYTKLELTFKSKIYYFKKWFPRYVPLLKAIMFFQIIIQYIKGKQGREFKKLVAIYLRSIHYQTPAKSSSN